MIHLGETAKQIFERAQLPNDVLGRIWNLADRDQKGYLGLTEFIIAMHLLASFKNGSMRALPQLLPAGLYEAANRRGGPRQPGSRPTSDSTPASAIPRQFSGGYQHPKPPSRSGTMPFQQSTAVEDQWAVTPQDKAQFDQIFATVDTQNRGFITGEQAVGFFSNSRLPEEALAQIWDLADINSEGQLSRDEFAVAMFLIRQQRSKKDGRDVLPQSLPAHLIPPSMRRQPVAPQQPTAPVFDNAANITAPKSASEDLFGLDAISSPAPSPAAPLQAKTTGDSSYVATPPRTQASPPPQSFQQQQQQPPSHFKPFIPSSSFGQTMMTPQSTGSASTASPAAQSRSIPPQQKQVSALDDLLGDNDPEVSKNLTNETSELGNLSNQVSTLSTQMQDVKTRQGTAEQNLSQTQQQKRMFEARLGQLRSAYEQEVREVEALEEKLKTSRSETGKLQQDMAMIQGTHQNLQNEHQQIAEALNVDQSENANLKERIRQSNTQIAELKPQLEKIKSDARQQKGLVAINKKQLATNEAELEKIRADLAESQREHEEAKRELEQSQRDIEAASKVVAEARSPPAAVPPQAAVASPVASATSMNPFFRQTSNATGTDRGVASPFTPSQTISPPPNHDAFDSLFGPSASASSGPPPATSFGHDGSIPRDGSHPMASQASSESPSIPTPSGSPPPSNFSDSPQTSAEPPAPPQSRQITSSFLPLRPSVDRSGSESSSVKVLPPASRMGDRPEFDTPTERELSTSETPIPESPKQHFEEMAAKVPQADASQITLQSTEPSGSNKDVPRGSSDPEERSAFGPPSAAFDFPGAFPRDETPEPSFLHTTPYSSKLDPRVDSTPRSLVSSLGPEATPSRSEDPFALPGNGEKSPAATKEDFDSAFAGFDKGKAPEHANGTVPQAPKTQGEFPPIQELGVDDESDSDDDRGFDDAFTSHSANKTAESGPNQALQNPSATAQHQLAPVRPPFNTVESGASQLPTPGAQTSPPTYDQTFGSSANGTGQRKESNQFPAEYSGLLPSRDDPSAAPASLPPPQSNVAAAAGIDRGLNFFGSGSPGHAAGHAAPSSSFAQDHSPMSPGASTAAPYAYTQGSPPPVNTTPSKPEPQTLAGPAVPPKAPAPHDDFDDEFADLENAHEESDHGDTDFASSRRTDFDEFNPNFDSPIAGGPHHTAQSSTTLPSAAPSDAFADFESSISGSKTSGATAPSATNNTETPSHDWDAIFAGLDSPSHSSQQNNGVAANPGPRDFSSAQAQGFGQSQINRGLPTENKTGTSKPPQLNRVLSDDGEHDDPILKRLTGMGYPRDDSLKALEKFDYNLDKVRLLS